MLVVRVAPQQRRLAVAALGDFFDALRELRGDVAGAAQQARNKRLRDVQGNGGLRLVWVFPDELLEQVWCVHKPDLTYMSSHMQGLFLNGYQLGKRLNVTTVTFVSPFATPAP